MSAGAETERREGRRGRRHPTPSRLASSVHLCRNRLHRASPSRPRPRAPPSSPSSSIADVAARCRRGGSARRAWRRTATRSGREVLSRGRRRRPGELPGSGPFHHGQDPSTTGRWQISHRVPRIQYRASQIRLRAHLRFCVRVSLWWRRAHRWVEAQQRPRLRHLPSRGVLEMSRERRSGRHQSAAGKGPRGLA